MKGILLILLLFIGYLGLVFFKHEDIASSIKPLLVPALLYSFYASVKEKGNYKIIGALVLSTLGDILLIFDGRPFFILGLLSFLLAHVLYVLVFRSRVGTIKLDFYTVLCSLLILSYYFFFMKLNNDFSMEDLDAVSSSMIFLYCSTNDFLFFVVSNKCKLPKPSAPLLADPSQHPCLVSTA